MTSALVAFLVYWLILFVACYIVSEYGQNFFYDEATPALAPKLAVGTLILAGLATWLHPSYDTMFTSDIGWTVLQAIAWVAVFTLILGFHPPHALGVGLVTMVLAVGMATLAVDSLRGNAPSAARREIRVTPKPLRRPAFAPTAPPDAKGAGAATQPPPAEGSMLKP